MLKSAGFYVGIVPGLTPALTIQDCPAWLSAGGWSSQPAPSLLMGHQGHPVGLVSCSQRPLLTLGLALGSPIFPSGCEGKLGVALESLQGLRDLT